MLPKRGKLRPEEAGMKNTKVAWLALGMLGAAAPVSAQSFPSKTITIISPAPAAARHRHHRPRAGAAVQQGVRPAGGGREQARRQQPARRRYIVNSAPDGHTLFIAPDGTFVANPSL